MPKSLKDVKYAGLIAQRQAYGNVLQLVNEKLEEIEDKLDRLECEWDRMVDKIKVEYLDAMSLINDVNDIQHKLIDKLVYHFEKKDMLSKNEYKYYFNKCVEEWVKIQNTKLERN